MIAARLSICGVENMAETGKRATIPYILSQNWWDLPRRFVNAVPNRVTTDLLQSWLNITAVDWARTLVRYLTLTGLIDESGKPTQLAYDWRLNEHYADAVSTIWANIYPDALREACPGPTPDRIGV